MIQLETGIIVRALSGTYDVKIDQLPPDADGVGRGVVVCKPRGVFRKLGINPLVGDRVTISGSTIQEVLPRRNQFVRPPVANVEAMVLVASETIPVTDMFVLDTLIAFAELNNAEPIIAVNKTDLASAESLYRTYSEAGFTAIRVSAVTGDGIAELSAALSGKLCAFAGDTGVGKSSIINAISQLSGAGELNLNLSVGEVSSKLGRGRHTTRMTQLFELGGGTMLIDAAGFAAVEEIVIPLDGVERAFREFAPYSGVCRFADCRHLKEPDCTVREALASGTIAESRYASYTRLLEIALNREANKYK